MFDIDALTSDQKKIVQAAVHLGWRVENLSDVVTRQGCNPSAIIMFNTGERPLPNGNTESDFWRYGTAMAVFQDGGSRVEFTQGHYDMGWSRALYDFAVRAEKN